MFCTLSNMALNLDEKVELQKFLKEHINICPDIQKECDYSITFRTIYGGEGVEAKARCRSCGKNHTLTK